MSSLVRRCLLIVFIALCTVCPYVYLVQTDTYVYLLHSKGPNDRSTFPLANSTAAAHAALTARTTQEENTKLKIEISGLKKELNTLRLPLWLRTAAQRLTA